MVETVPTTTAGPNQPVHLSPQANAWRLLKNDLNDIGIIFGFALVIGLLSMATPLAVEALVNTVAFGQVLQPVVVLSTILFAFLAFQAGVRLLQVYVAEMIQRRIFARSAADLVHRLPKIRHESQDATDLPLLVNQFLDVAGVQKTAATLLLEGSRILLSAITGMTVLAFYHPWLLGFDLVLVTALTLVLTVAGLGATNTAVKESKAKYRAQGWFEEMASTPRQFASTHGFSLAVERANALTSDYVKFRSKHFRILIRQNALALLVQAVASTVLLGIGGWLVITNRLTLGQLVAAELIVTIIVGSVAKLGKLLESYYDLLAASDKVGGLSELPEWPAGTAELPQGPLPVRTRQLSYAYEDNPASLFDINIDLDPGEAVAVTGPSGSGKSTLMEVLAGLRPASSGLVAIDGLDPFEIVPFTLRDCVVLARDNELFDGTIRENVAVGSPLVGVRETWDVLEAVGLAEAIRCLPETLMGTISTERNPLSSGQTRLLMMARALAARPGILLIDGLLDMLPLEEAESLLETIRRDYPCTLVLGTTRPEIAALLPAEVSLSHCCGRPNTLIDT